MNLIGKSDIVRYDRQKPASNAKQEESDVTQATSDQPRARRNRSHARAAYPKGNVYMHMRDELGTIYEDESFANLFPIPNTGQPAEAPWRLALVTIMQFAEGLSDRQAADAVRGRIDVKYALSLDLTDPGFDASVLSEFRARLVAGHAQEHLLTANLTLFKERGWLKARGKQGTDSTHVLAKIRAINRLICVGETLRHALNCLAVVAASRGCLSRVSRSGWIGYGVRLEDSRPPSGEEERQAWAQAVGQDGSHLLSALFGSGAPTWLREVPAVEILRRVWVQNYQQKIFLRLLSLSARRTIWMRTTCREAHHQLGGVQGPSDRDL